MKSNKGTIQEQRQHRRFCTKCAVTWRYLFSMISERCTSPGKMLISYCDCHGSPLPRIGPRSRKIVLLATFVIAILRALFDVFASEPQFLEDYIPEVIIQNGAERTCLNLVIPIETLRTPAKPQPMIAPALFLHIGKAGGGTIEHRAATSWNMALCRCHPDPCPRLVDGSTHYLINLRDPIDRFVSIFNWRMIVLCHPEGDARTPVVKGAFADTQKLCEMEMPYNQDEIKALFYTYQGDVNRLAESLCPATEASLDAEPDLALIRHMPTLFDWLGMDWTNFHTKLFPIVQDHSVDLEQQVDEAIVWLYNKTKFENQEDFDLRSADAFRFNAELSAVEDTSVDHRHSSGIHPQLTKDAERCLAMLFASDYHIMKEMVDRGVCKTDACLSGLASILLQRSNLLVGDVYKQRSKPFRSFISAFISQFVSL